MPIVSPTSIAGALIDPSVKQLLLDQRSFASAITALAGGTQAGTSMSAAINRIAVVATIGDSVLLPPAVPGVRLIVVNAAANSANVFPSTGDAINAIAANGAYALAGAKAVEFICAIAGTWNTLLTA